MQAIVEHPTYGVIVYEESGWTGKKTITFNGLPLTKLNKTTYELPANPATETPALTVSVKGNYMSGVTLTVGDEVIPVTPKASAADYVLGILPAVLFFLLIIQGAIGGALAGMMALGGIMLMKSRPNLKQKLLISLGASAVIVAVGVVLLALLLSQPTP